MTPDQVRALQASTQPPLLAPLPLWLPSCPCLDHITLKRPATCVQQLTCPPACPRTLPLQEELRPILLRRMKEDVETLPEKEEVSWLRCSGSVLEGGGGGGAGAGCQREEVRGRIVWLPCGRRRAGEWGALAGSELHAAGRALHSALLESRLMPADGCPLRARPARPPGARSSSGWS